MCASKRMFQTLVLNIRSIWKIVKFKLDKLETSSILKLLTEEFLEKPNKCQVNQTGSFKKMLQN